MELAASPSRIENFLTSQKGSADEKIVINDSIIKKCKRFMLFLIKFGTKLGIKLDISKHFRENPLFNRDFSLK